MVFVYFWEMNIHNYQLFWCEQKGIRLLTRQTVLGSSEPHKDLTAISGQTMASIRHGPKITTSRLISELVWFIQLYIYI